MVFEPESSMKRKMAKNGSVLQYMHSVAGAGKGLIAMGIMLIGIGAMLTAALFNMKASSKKASQPDISSVLTGSVKNQSYHSIRFSDVRRTFTPHTSPGSFSRLLVQPSSPQNTRSPCPPDRTHTDPRQK